MGNTLESLSPRRGVKRGRDELEDKPEDNGNLSSPDGPGDFLTPKRKRTQSTAKYILKTLFEEGTDSDITINACGREWRLHKLYLCQCRYFDSMFNGPWREAEQSVVNMEISDENIDQNALKIAFQSLYTDNVFVKPAQAVGVLAAATLLQLDPLIEHCKAVMKGCIAPDTVCSFYNASERYGLTEVKDLCLKWLQHCLMVPGYASLICHIQEDLLLTLLSSPDLWLMQVEVDVYTLLKKWIFIQLNPSWKGSREQLYSDSEDYFRRRAKQEGDTCFLETESGQCFVHMFKKIRWMYVINDLSSIQLVKDDKIVPLAWLDPFFSFCWKHHLMIEQGVDKGPQQVSEEEFLERSMRCGRILLQEQDYCWRWVGYNFGVDLLITCRNRVIMIKRNGGSQNFECLISQQSQRHIMVRMCLSPIRKKEAGSTQFSTGIKSFSLSPDEEVVLMPVNLEVKFPIQVTMNLLFVSPSTSLPYPSLAVPPPLPVSIPAPSSSGTHVGTSATTVVSTSTPALNPATSTSHMSVEVSQDQVGRGQRGQGQGGQSQMGLSKASQGSVDRNRSIRIADSQNQSDCPQGRTRHSSYPQREHSQPASLLRTHMHRSSALERNRDSVHAESEQALDLSGRCARRPSSSDPGGGDGSSQSDAVSRSAISASSFSAAAAASVNTPETSRNQVSKIASSRPCSQSTRHSATCSRTHESASVHHPSTASSADHQLKVTGRRRSPPKSEPRATL